MNARGMLKGLRHQYHHPLQYYVRIDNCDHPLNDYIGEHFHLHFQGHIQCIYCGRKIKKTYNNGSCYPCFRDRPENDLCIVKPELCHFEEGTCRDDHFGETQCMVPHYVYLALSSDVKVGVTRKNNELTRWGNQGATQAFPIAEVPNRKIAGELEVALSQHITDKTNWRKMLKGDLADVHLDEVRTEIIAKIPEPLTPFILTEEEIVEFTYPQLKAIDKIKSYNLDKHPTIEDRLIGIKGQYLIFESGVINMRKYSGYHILLESKQAS